MGRAFHYHGERMPSRGLGFWVQIQVPAALAGKALTLQPGMVAKSYFSKGELQALNDTVHEQFLNGNWVDPRQLGELPSAPGTQARPADFSYAATDQHRLWQVWIDTATTRPILELEVKYPPGVLQRKGGRGYLFRLALEWATNEADRLNNAFSNELTEDSGVVLAPTHTQPLPLSVPK